MSYWTVVLGVLAIVSFGNAFVIFISMKDKYPLMALFFTIVVSSFDLHVQKLLLNSKGKPL